MKTIQDIKRGLYYRFLFLILFFFFILPTIFPYFSVLIILSINIIYLITNIIKIFLFSIGIFRNDIKDFYKKDSLNIKDDELPIYSILLPLRKEKDFTIVELLKNLNNLDYPKNKLDIKMIVDFDDISTINICKDILTKNKNLLIDLIIVPKLNITSKPISCNYALKYAKGEFITIYDAEDKPEKYQLKKAIQKFKELDDDFICLQASLNYYNKYDNFLSYCFSIEYSMWFDFTIKSINTFTPFFPLGGTSNHFKTKQLKEIGAWDGYNVTEDAEIAVRIIKAGYKISSLNSINEEESPITIKPWLKQITRWFKGFMQTFCEHINFKKPIATLNSKNKNLKFKKTSKIGFLNLIVFHTFITMSFFFFISLFSLFYNNIIYLKLIDIYPINNPFLPNIPNFLNCIIHLNFYMLLFITYGSVAIICIEHKIKFKPIYFILFPFYWILHYIAGLRALYYLGKTPFYWAKTEHGLFKSKR